MSVNDSSWFTEAELHDVEPPPFLIDGVIPLRSVNMFFGEFNIGKTFIAMDMAAHVSIGKPWIGKDTMEGDVLYIASEGDPGNMGVRMEAWRESQQIEFPVPMLFYTDVVSLIKDAEELIAGSVARGLRPRLVVVDTLAMALDDNENDNQVMNDLIKKLRSLQEYEVDGEVFEIAWLLVHHTGWEKGRPRGGSSMPAGLDYILGLEGLTENTVKLFHYKAKNSAKFNPMVFETVEYADSVVYAYVPEERAAKLRKSTGDSTAAGAHREFEEWLDNWPDDVPFSRSTYSDALKKMKYKVDKKAVSAAFSTFNDLIELDYKKGNEEFFLKAGHK